MVMQDDRRQRTLVVLNELERSIAEWVRSRAIRIPNSLASVLRDRMKKRSGPSDASVSELIGECYLEELLQIAIENTHGTAEHDDARALHRLTQEHQLVTIRNVVAHPVRAFQPHYWYLVAAAATHPAFLRLRLTSVPETVDAVESGKLSASLAETEIRAAAEPVNNLTDSPEYLSTGLIGRAVELKRLGHFLTGRQGRVIALNGGPGVGKSSLLHETLRTAVADHRAYAPAFAVLNVHLSGDLIRRSAHARPMYTSIDQLERSIVHVVSGVGLGNDNDTFKDFVGQFGAQRIVIGIDDATVLCWRSASHLSRWVEGLPPAWSLLFVTEVITETWPIVSLSPLSDDAGALLARRLLDSGGVSVDESVVSAITFECGHDPALIKSACEAFRQQRDAVAVSRRARHDSLMTRYLHFFGNLRSIDVAAVEASYVIGKWFTAEEAAYFMQISSSDALAVLSDLARTPLIDDKLMHVTGPHHRQFCISDVAGYVLTQRPLDLEQRQRALDRRDRLSAKRVKRPKRLPGDPFAWESIDPDELPIIKELHAALVSHCYGRSHRDIDDSADAVLSQLLLRVDDALLQNPGHGVLFRLRAFILQRKGEYYGALDAAMSACLTDKPDYPSVPIAATLLDREGRHEDSYNLIARFAAVSGSQFDNEEGLLEHSPILLDLWLHALMYREQVDDLLLLCKQWPTANDAMREVMVNHLCHVAGSLLIEESDTKAIEIIEHSLLPALTAEFEKRGYRKNVCDALSPLLPQFTVRLGSKVWSAQTQMTILSFLNRHLRYIVPVVDLSEEPFASRRVQSVLMACQSVSVEGLANPFRGRYWRDVKSGDTPHARLLRRGFIETAVKVSPRKPGGVSPPYVIVRAADGNQFFVTFDMVENIDGRSVSRGAFQKLRRDSIIYVRPNWELGRRDRAVRVLGALITGSSPAFP